MDPYIETLDAGDIAKLLRKTKRTVLEDRRRRPLTLPPELDIPGSKTPLWLRSTVELWLSKRVKTRRERP